jgi:hypothetical protein
MGLDEDKIAKNSDLRLSELNLVYLSMLTKLHLSL